VARRRPGLPATVRALGSEPRSMPPKRQILHDGGEAVFDKIQDQFPLGRALQLCSLAPENLETLMLIKCTCNNCSTHLEFESGNEGTTITCPSCGMETQLYVPQSIGALNPAIMPPRSFPPPKSAKTAPRSANAFASKLAQIRLATCYKTLRIVIDVVFTLSKVLVALAGTLLFVGSIFTPFEDISVPAKIAIQVAFVLATLLAVGLLHAAHQASLLLVDIADSSVRLVTVQESLSGESATG